MKNEQDVSHDTVCIPMSMSVKSWMYFYVTDFNKCWTRPGETDLVRAGVAVRAVEAAPIASMWVNGSMNFHVTDFNKGWNQIVKTDLVRADGAV